MGLGSSTEAPKEPLSKRLPADGSGCSEILRSSKSENLISSLPDNVTTLADNWKRAVEKFGNKPCMGWRVNDGPYQSITYSQANERVKNFGSGLVNMGFKPKDFLGIYSINRVEWVLTEQANNMYNMTLVPLYDTLGAESAEFIINQTELRIIILTADKAKNVLDLLGKCPSLKTLVFFDALPEEMKSKLEEKGIKVLSFPEVENIGAQNVQPPSYPSADDIATICYTSGTTGFPKGAMLAHGNYVACAAGAYPHGLRLTSDDVYISYLPLAHVYERIVHVVIFFYGASMGFYRGDVIKHLFDDIAALRPTIFASVPRLFSRLYDKVMNTVNASGGVKQTLFQTAFDAKKEGLKRNQYTHMVWDSLVFSNIAAKLGGRVRLIVTGSAPISPEILTFLRVCFSCPVLEGYGQTECGAAATLTSSSEASIGHVGTPLCSNEIKLVDVPEMNYFGSENPPRGEVCFRGANVFKGYFKDAEKTAEALDKDGWLHSGDIGTFDENGNLKIIDRKKNIFKLSQGEYVAPEKLENIYARSPFVAQVFVHGDSLKASLVAIVVVDEEFCKGYVKEKNLGENMGEVIKKAEFKKAVLDSMIQTGKENQLKGFELVKDIYIHDKPFSVENDLLTPTFKLKRPQAKKYFDAQIAELYKNID